MMTKTTDEAQGQWVATAEQGISISTKAAAASVGVPAGSVQLTPLLLVACFDADVHTCNCRRVATHLRDLDREGRGHPRGQTSNRRVL